MTWIYLVKQWHTDNLDLPGYTMPWSAGPWNRLEWNLPQILEEEVDLAIYQALYPTKQLEHCIQQFTRTIIKIGWWYNYN